MRDDNVDAMFLRNASRVLHVRAKKKTFMLRVIIRVLQRTADRIETKGRGREQGKDDPVAATRSGPSRQPEGR